MLERTTPNPCPPVEAQGGGYYRARCSRLGKCLLATGEWRGARGFEAEGLTVMRKDLEQKLIIRWPTWFHVNGDIRETLMPQGFTLQDGWFGIIWRLCEDLEPLVPEVELEAGRPFEVRQVKEKFGGLRFRTNLHSEAISKRIEAATLESYRTCEVCGQPGSQTEGAWSRTRCKLHAKAEGG